MATPRGELFIQIPEISEVIEKKDFDPGSPNHEIITNNQVNGGNKNNIKQFLIPRHSLLDIVKHQQKRTNKSPFSPQRHSMTPTSFDQAFKLNIIQYLSKEEKGLIEMKLLKKHLSSCSFFQNYAIPMGEDVFESCIHKIKIQQCASQSFLINKGDQINKLYILISGSAIKSKSKNIKQDVFFPESEASTPAKTSQFKVNQQQLQQVYTFTSQCNSPTTSQNANSDQSKLFPICSLLDQQFIQNQESQHYFYNCEESTYGYITSSDFMECISQSKNSELIHNLNILKQSQFLLEWPIGKLKSILSQSQVISYQRNQYVYKQGDKSTHWFLIQDGEFEYTKEVLIDNEINDILKACLNTMSHTFKKQSIVTDESQKGKTKGEIFGIEELIPNQDRICSVKCISSSGTVRQINEAYIIKAISKNNEEGKKLTNLAQQKINWLDRATKEKMPINQQIHHTILDSKRNRALQIIKNKEEEREQDQFMSSIQMQILKSKNNNNNQINSERINLSRKTQRSMINMNTLQYPQAATSRDLLSLSNTQNQRQLSNIVENNESLIPISFSTPKLQPRHQKNITYTDSYSVQKGLFGETNDMYASNHIKTPISLVQPEKNITFIKTQQDDKQNKTLQKELSKERKQLNEAKGDLLLQYRVTLDKYFQTSNQKLYKKIEYKKLGVDQYLNPIKQNQEFNSPSKFIKPDSDITPLRMNRKIRRSIHGDDDERVQSIEFPSQIMSKTGQRFLSEYNQKFPVNLVSQNFVSQKDKHSSSFFSGLQKKYQQREQIIKDCNSPNLELSKRLFLPANTKKMILSQQNTPRQNHLEGYHVNTQSSQFNNKNQRLEKIIRVRNQLTSSQTYRDSKLNEIRQVSNSFQMNSSPLKRTEHTQIQEIKQIPNTSQQRSSSSNH